MKVGLYPQQLAQPLTWQVSFTSMRGRETLAHDLHATSAELSVDGTSQIPERLTATFPPDLLPTDYRAPLAAFGQVIRPSVKIVQGGREFVYEIGWYLIQSWEEKDNGEIQVEADGLLRKVADAPWPSPSSPAPGSTLLQEAQRLAFPLPVDLDPKVANVVLDRGIAWGNDRLNALYDLGRTHNVRWSVKPDGYLWALPTRSGKDTTATYTGRDLALTLLRRGDHTMANQVSAIHKENSEKQANTTVGTASSMMPPYDTEGYGLVHKIVETESSTTVAALQAHAQQVLNEERNKTRVRQVEIVADPAIELWDMVAVILDNETVVGTVQAYTLPLSSGGKMRLDLQEILY